MARGDGPQPVECVSNLLFRIPATSLACHPQADQVVRVQNVEIGLVAFLSKSGLKVGLVDLVGNPVGPLRAAEARIVDLVEGFLEDGNG
jgi:hypothetical protein